MAFTIYAVIDASVAPWYGAGDYATIAYGQRIVMGVGTLVIAGLGTISSVAVTKAEALSREKAIVASSENLRICVYWSTGIAVILYFTVFSLAPIGLASSKLSPGHTKFLIETVGIYAVPESKRCIGRPLQSSLGISRCIASHDRKDTDCQVGVPHF